MKLQLASASGNVFGYVKAGDGLDLANGPAFARALCPRGIALGLDGIFLLEGLDDPWRLEHWDVDGAHTFCSNGSRAALSLLNLEPGRRVTALSAGISFELKQTPDRVAIRMPEGAGFGLLPFPLEVPFPATFGYIGNPQLVLEVPAVDEVDLAAFAPPLRHHSSIPGGTNVNVIEVVRPGEARIRSWERGVESETLCCGTGSAVAAAWLADRTGIQAWTLQTASGDPVHIKVDWAQPRQWKNLWLSGPIRRLGTLELDPGLAILNRGTIC